MVPLDPTVGTIIAVTKKILEHKEAICTTIEDVVNTWNSEKSTEEKIADTIYEVAKGTAKIAIEEVKQKLLEDGAKNIVDLIDRNHTIEALEAELSKCGVKVGVRDFIQDSISNEMETFIEGIK